MKNSLICKVESGRIIRHFPFLSSHVFNYFFVDDDSLSCFCDSQTNPIVLCKYKLVLVGSITDEFNQYSGLDFSLWLIIIVLSFVFHFQLTGIWHVCISLFDLSWFCINDLCLICHTLPVSLLLDFVHYMHTHSARPIYAHCKVNFISLYEV